MMVFLLILSDVIHPTFAYFFNSLDEAVKKYNGLNTHADKRLYVIGLDHGLPIVEQWNSETGAREPVTLGRELLLPF
jgi:hypothetical protein